MNREKTVSFVTLGCRLNIFESDGLATIMQKEGFEVQPSPSRSNIIVVNTCTVTNKADSKNRNIIRKLVRENPNSDVWVTGCYAQTDKDVILGIPGVAGVVGNDEKSKLPYKILKKLEGNYNFPSEHYNRFSYSDVLPNQHTRAYLKIQDGCNRKCSYCKIPSARGKGVSRGFQDVIDQIKFLQDSSVAEIILTGVNLGWYKDKNNKFNHLLESILNILSYSRLRLSSIEPSDVDNGLADLLQHPRFCKYLHVPLQSGSNKILKLMQRSYRMETFAKRINLVKMKNPNLFLGTDIITGFPGETQIDFEQTVKLIKDLEFTKIHAFPFSIRKGTKASLMQEHIPSQEKKEKVKILQKLSIDQTYKYAKKQIDKVFESVLEKDGTCITDNYLKIQNLKNIENFQYKYGQFLNVKIDNVEKTENNVLMSGFMIRL